MKTNLDIKTPKPTSHWTDTIFNQWSFTKKNKDESENVLDSLTFYPLACVMNETPLTIYDE